ncbi:hypothetical protein J7J58_01920 [candidate division WOR-3 bacterium]|nr:hypothetical protein [candidate division WOR-3 bacterium]
MRSKKISTLFIIALFAVNFIFGQNYFNRKIGLTEKNFISSSDNAIINYFPSISNKNGFMYGKLNYDNDYMMTLNLNISRYSFDISNYVKTTDTITYDIMPEFRYMNMTDFIFGYKARKWKYSLGISFSNSSFGGDSGNVGLNDLVYIGGIGSSLSSGEKTVDFNMGIKVEKLTCSRNINGNISKNDNRPGYELNIMATIKDGENIFDIYILGSSNAFNFLYNDSIAVYNGEEIYSTRYTINPGISWSRSYADFADIRLNASYFYSSFDVQTYDNSGDTGVVRQKEQFLPRISYQININLYKNIYTSIFGNYKYKIVENNVNSKKTLEKEPNFLYNVGVGYNNGDVSVIVGGKRLIENVLQSFQNGKFNIPLQLRFYYHLDNISGV